MNSVVVGNCHAGAVVEIVWVEKAAGLDGGIVQLWSAVVWETEPPIRSARSRGSPELHTRRTGPSRC